MISVDAVTHEEVRNHPAPQPKHSNLYYSFNLHEAETVHPETADTDSTKVQNFFNSLKEQPLTTGFILEVMNGIQENQLVFAQNMSSHIKVIKELGNGVNELSTILDELKQGHGQLSKGQRTLEDLEEK